MDVDDNTQLQNPDNPEVVNNLDNTMRDPKTLVLGSTLRLKDVDVDFKVGQFLQGYVCHFLYFIVTGPLTPLLMAPINRSTIFARNMGMYPSRDLMPLYVF
jgi:hypothetical protein